MEKKYCMLIALILGLLGCNSKKPSPLSQELICTELLSDSAIAELNQPKAAAEKGSLWPHALDMPLVITAKFLNGTAFQRSKVVEYAAFWNNASALGWNGKRKIKITFVPDSYPSGVFTNIRILFQSGGSSSYVGSDCKNVPLDKATTFFGWVDQNHSEEEIRQVILHELGHAIGLIHEHQSPDANIPWDTAKVYQYYHDTQNPPWERAKVNQNIFYLYSASTTKYTKFDSLSIMCYAIPSTITIGGYSTPWNSNLSQLDSEFIKNIYPYSPCIVNETCCFDRRGRRILCP